MESIQNEEFNQKLSTNLMQQLSNIIDGNQASIDDIKSIEYEIKPIIAQLNIVWIFFADYQEESVAGASYVGTTCASVNKLEDITKELEEQAKYDKKLRTPFVQNLKNFGREGVTKANKTYIVKNFGTFSAKDICHTCNGACQVRCSSCGGNGKQRCRNCGGSGRLTKYRYNSRTKRDESYSAYCSYCGGGGSSSCSSCSGSGKVRCSNCKGYGYFIIIRKITAEAKPMYFVRTDSPLVNEQLQQYLNDQSIDFIYNSVYFELSDQKTSELDEEMFIYEGKSVVIKQDLEVKSKEYTCYALSNPPHPFVRPTIFDDLFADELEFLKGAVGQKKYIDRKKALEFFDIYSGQPVLDRAIKEVANVRKESKEDTTDIVIEACQGFISKDAASALSSHINKFMDKVSPVYSPLMWYTGILLLAVIGLVVFEYSFEQRGTKHLLELTGLFMIATLAIAFIIYPLSLLITLFKRRRIPIEYRQNLRHGEIFKLYSKVALVIFILASGYGILSNKGYVPKTNGVPLNMVTYYTKNGYDFLQKKVKIFIKNRF